MHNIFAREHNNIVAMLRKSHPEMNEQAIFDHARMINAAVIAKIHTVEWTPAILPNQALTVAMNANWYGLQKFLKHPTIDTPVLRAAMKVLPADQQSVANPALFGLVGNTRDLHNVPYSLTEDFVSVYRMHPLLPDTIDVRSATDGSTVASYPLVQTRLDGGRTIEETNSMTNLMYTFGVEHPGALVLANYPKFMQELQLPYGVVDMGTIDILRDRERGIPRYNDFREALGLKRVDSIEALTPDAATQAALHDAYGADADAINRVDALVGTMAEAQRPTCYGFGETLFQVFTVMASRRLQADRFFTTDFNAATYTQEGMDWISQATMKAVLLRNFPDLASTGLSKVANAFYPWQ
jgi:hypothetical protein